MEFDFNFEGVAIEWRGPAPFVFVPVPTDISVDIKEMSSKLTYGWGVIPATVTIGSTTYTTSLFPKNGAYLVPIKVVVQRAEGVEVGSNVEIKLVLSLSI